MQITEIQSSYSRRVQLERYEPVEYSETITATLEDGDDAEEVSKELQEIVRDNVERGVLTRVMTAKMEDDEDE